MKLLFLLCLLHLAMQATAQTCGRPGKPEHGDRIPLNESYNEGDQVMYICDNGYYLKREDEFVQAENRTCQFNGTWSGTVPECDYIDVIFNTALDVTGVNLPFLIDGKDETCGEVKFNKSAPGATRSFNIPWHNFTHSTAYVRISLGNTDNRMKHKIRVVLLPSYAQCKEVPPPKVTEVLLKCDSRESTTHAWFSFPTALLHNEQALSICSLNIFVQSDATCGSPDEPLHGTFTHNGATSAYSCKSGYSLTGDSAASCTNETGYRWHPYSAPECLSNGETGTCLPWRNAFFGVGTAAGITVIIFTVWCYKSSKSPEKTHFISRTNYRAKQNQKERNPRDTLLPTHADEHVYEEVVLSENVTKQTGKQPDNGHHVDEFGYEIPRKLHM